MRTKTLTTFTVLALTGCAGAEVTRTSENTMIIDAGAAPACGPSGAAKVANRAAAIETLRAGFDRYIIVSGLAQNNVVTTQLPGSYQTHGTLVYGGGFGSYQGTTRYTPGPTIVAGSHDRSLAIVMFRKGELGWERGIDARSALGPDWQQAIKDGIRTCL